MSRNEARNALVAVSLLALGGLLSALMLSKREPPSIRVEGAEGEHRPVVEHTVHGSVRDDRGRPVRGARVALRPVTALGVPAQPSPVGALATDSRGEFRFTGLGAGAYELNAGADGHLDVRLGFAVEPGKPATPALVLKRAVTLSGRVEDETGNAVAGASVTARQGDLRAEATCDAQGAFAFDALAADEPVTLQVSHARFGITRHEAVLPGEDEVRLRLRQTGDIAGILLDAADVPLGGSSIEAVVLDHGADDVPLLVTQTNQDGRFVLAGVPAGQVRLVGTGSQHLAVVGEPVTVRPGETTHANTLVAERGATLRVTVVDAQERGIADVQLALGPVPRGSGPIAPLPEIVGRTDDRGQWQAVALPAGDMILRATTPQATRLQRVTIPATREVDVKVALEPAGSLRYSVAGAEATQLCDLVLRGPVDDEGGGLIQRLQVPSSGVLHQLAAGRYEVYVLGPGAVARRAADGWIVTGSRRSEVAVRGLNTVEVILPPAERGAVEGVVRLAGRPVVGAEVRIEALAPRQRAVAGGPWSLTTRTAQRTDDQGGFQWRGLVPGDYLIGCWPPGALLPMVRAFTLAVAGDVVKLDIDWTTGVLSLFVQSAVQAEPLPGAVLELRPTLGSALAAIGRADPDAVQGALGFAAFEARAGAAGLELELPRGTYEVIARAPNHQEDSIAAVDLDVPTGCRRVLALHPVGALTVRVLDGQGRPAAGAAVVIEIAEGQRHQASTGDDGLAHFEAVRPGRHRLEARHAVGLRRPAHGAASVQVEALARTRFDLVLSAR